MVRVSGWQMPCPNGSVAQGAGEMGGTNQIRTPPPAKWWPRRRSVALSFLCFLCRRGARQNVQQHHRWQRNGAGGMGGTNQIRTPRRMVTPQTVCCTSCSVFSMSAQRPARRATAPPMATATARRLQLLLEASPMHTTASVGLDFGCRRRCSWR